MNDPRFQSEDMYKAYDMGINKSRDEIHALRFQLEAVTKSRDEWRGVAHKLTESNKDLSDSLVMITRLSMTNRLTPNDFEISRGRIKESKDALDAYAALKASEEKEANL